MKGQASRSEDGAGEGGMGSEWQEQTWGDLATLEYGKALRGLSECFTSTPEKEKCINLCW